MVSTETLEFAELYAKAQGAKDVEGLMKFMHEDITYEDYMRPFVTKGRDTFGQTMGPLFEPAKHHVCKVTRVSGADISHSSTVDESLVTTIEWLVVAEMINETEHLPFKVGQKVQVDGVSLWWWKEGKIIRSANYGGLKPIN